MSRSLPWAALALFPLVGLGFLAATGDDPSPPFLPRTEFVVLYWWLILGTLLLAQMVLFAVHAWRNPKVGPNRRLVWVVAIVLFPIVATPAYWWTYTGR